MRRKNHRERGDLFHYKGIDVLQDQSGSLFSQWLTSYKVEDNKSSFFLSQLKLKVSSLQTKEFLKMPE